MFRKATIASVALIVVAGFLTAAPASAAVKINNGVACTKSGATAKTSAGIYKCAKNPIVKNSKLTWLSVDCINTAKSYIKAKNNLPAIKTATDTTIAELDAEIIVQQKVLADSLADIETYRLKIVGVYAKLTTMKADAANLTKNSASIAAYERAVKSYEAAIASKTRVTSATGTVPRSINRITTSRAQALTGYENAQRDVKDGLDMTKLICGKGY